MPAGSCNLIGITPLERNLDDKGDEGKKREKRSDRESRGKIVLVVKNLDLKRHGVGLASDVAETTDTAPNSPMARALQRITP